MHFAKKNNKKGLKKTQANNDKVMSACAEAVKALVKTKEVKPKMLKGASLKLDRLALLAHPKHGKRACAHKASTGSAGQRSKPKPRPRVQLQLQYQHWLWLRLLLLPARVPRPPRVPRSL
ncbi:60S ribosomal protein L29 [Sciurus carolinensis]|uniref:60S ribosomal protein L29 n=1 Tax=Sciurus carolinensis TaxID=30640 RepID=A0AA41MML2_SCICA|nr:60S ribosomal protein L29 [Sciurus carolinensis]